MHCAGFQLIAAFLLRVYYIHAKTENIANTCTVTVEGPVNINNAYIDISLNSDIEIIYYINADVSAAVSLPSMIRARIAKLK